MLFIRRQARAGAEIVDPLAGTLADAGLSDETADRLLALRQIFPARLADDPRFRDAVLGAVRAMSEEGPRARLNEGASRG
jgi:fructuronate reductase